MLCILLRDSSIILYPDVLLTHMQTLIIVLGTVCGLLAIGAIVAISVALVIVVMVMVKRRQRKITFKKGYLIIILLHWNPQ